MCDTNRYYQMFQEMKQLNPNDTMQLILESKDPTEREFFELLGDFLLQQKQREAINRRAF